MTFIEFLMTNGDDNFADYMKHIERLEPLPEAFFNSLYEKFKIYFLRVVCRNPSALELRNGM